MIACGSSSNDGAPAGDSNDDDDSGPAGNDASALRDSATTSDASMGDGSLHDASKSMQDASIVDASTDGSTNDAGVVNAHLFSAGWWTTCAVRDAGSLYCWGYNGTGAVGDGTQTDRHSPVLIGGLPAIAQVGVASYGACALTTTGTVWCWGQAQDGELGDGISHPSPQLTPVEVSGLTDVVELSAGSHHFCVRKSDDSMWCWGYAYHGEVGDDELATVQPIAKILDGVAQISAHTYDTCAAMKDGTAKCWGDDVNGIDGNGTIDTPFATPQTVSNLTTAVKVNVGSLSACALLANGTADCWGDNAFGELGNGTTDLSEVPIAVPNLKDLVDIIPAQPAAGYGESVCALHSDGTLSCWGFNGYGELGDGVDAGDSHVPITVPNVSDVVAFDNGGGYVLVQKSDGSLWAWGLNTYGQLGNGTTTNAPAPVKIF
jgi:alpha-tubulin suppressor-like RCC1 family protein